MKIKKLLYSFKYAICGIINCIKNERNFRIHLCVLVYVLVFSAFYRFSKIEYAILISLFALVLFAEMINTSVENLVDIKTLEYNKNAKNAKDIAAGAVFVCALAAAVTGVIFFFDIDIISKIVYYFINNVFMLIILIISIILSLLFIFLPKNKIK